MSIDGNDTFATADVLTADASGNFQSDPSAELAPPDTDVDFYQLDLQAGPYFFAASSHTNGVNDPGYVDTVITLYDQNHNQLARNDDAFPRTTTDSSLLTMIGSAGTYYVKVEEFCESSLSMGNCAQGYFQSISVTAYTLVAGPIVAGPGNIPESAEPNNTEPTAATMSYAPAQFGSYYLSTLYGALPAGDSDWVKFTIPTDVVVAPGSRLDASFINPPPSIDGNGSNVNVGQLQVVDPMNMSVVAALDVSNEAIVSTRASISGLPLVAGKEYLLKVPYGSAAANGQSPFYFMLHGVGGANPVETNDTANGSAATPETPALIGTGYFVEGDVTSAIDTDYYLLSTGGQPNLGISCIAQRGGSGLRDFTVDVLKTDGTTLLTSATESATVPLVLTVDVTAETQVLVRMTASQDPTVTSTFYQCGLQPAP